MVLLTLLLCPKVEAQKNEPPATFKVMTFNSFLKTEKGKRRIDWVLTQGPVKVNRTEIVLFDKSKQLPSDHQPVTAIIQIEQPTKPNPDNRVNYEAGSTRTGQTFNSAVSVTGS